MRRTKLESKTDVPRLPRGFFLEAAYCSRISLVTPNFLVCCEQVEALWKVN